MNQEENRIRQIANEEATKVFNKRFAFTKEKLSDTPTDALQVVNRKYVTQNGTTLPNSPVTGQQFFSSVLSQPIYYNGNNWVDPTASVVA